MPLTIIRQDITEMQVDAIVNAANTHLIGGGGVSGAIFQKAGAQVLQEACDKLAPINVGAAVLTPAFSLPSRYIIHTAGPIYNADNKELSKALLVSSYTNTLNLAHSKAFNSIAFPLISSGIYGYPKRDAFEVARETISNWLQLFDMDVYLVVYDKKAFELSKSLLGDVQSYIDDHYIKSYFGRPRILRGRAGSYEEDIYEPDIYIDGALPDIEADDEDYSYPEHGAPVYGAPPASGSLEDLLSDLDEPFNRKLMRIIAKKSLSHAEVYRKANIDRKLFSKIISKKNYTPRKRTVLALAIALELPLEETESLLQEAGYALSPSCIFDVIVEYFIINKRYDIFEINEVLFSYDQAQLGSS